MQERTLTPKAMIPLYIEEIHMLEGLDDEELENDLDENPRIMPLFEIDIIETSGTYAMSATTAEHDFEPNTDALMELHRAQDAFEREMEISRRVTTTSLEEINVGTPDAPRTLSNAKNLPLRKKQP